MRNVYKECPTYMGRNFTIRLLEEMDVLDLHKIYKDKNAVPFFNGDNCHGDIFYYETLEQMKGAIKFWLDSYKNGWFVRFSILDHQNMEVIGTIECFTRTAKDFFTDTALLRLDLRSDYEKKEVIQEIIAIVEEDFYTLFGVSKIATKGFPGSKERLEALQSLGYQKSSKPLIGDKEYYEYWYK